MTYKIINYIIYSHIYFAFVLNLIESDCLKGIIALKESDVKDSKKVSDYLLEQIFNEFDFIKRTLLPLLGINNIIIFMNSIFNEIYEKLLNFKSGDDEERIKKNEESIESSVDNVIKDYSKSVKEYYKIEKSFVIENNDINNNDENQTVEDKIYNKDDIHDIISEKSEYYNNKENINKKYPLLPYFTYSNYSALNNDFQNQFFYFKYNNSDYPLISSILCDDKIFKIIEDLPKINKFINQVHDELNMRYTKEGINNKTIKEIFNDRLNEDIKVFNNIIETHNTLFDQKKKIDVNKKLFEIINIPGSTVNCVYMKIIETYNTFLDKMKHANINIFDEVIIQEAKENDYNINCVIKNNKDNDNKLAIKEKLDELILLYSKRERKKENKKGIFEINVYDGGKIIYNFSIIENKLEEQFIFGKKKFSEEPREFIFSNEIFKQENDIIKEFEKKYSLDKISPENKNKLMKYLNNRKNINEKNVINIFYELFFALRYTMQNASDIKFKNLKDLIKYLELKNYKFENLNNAISSLKDHLSIKTILHFYEIVVNEAFNNLTNDIETKIKDKGINIEENIINDIEKCFNENKIIKLDIIIPAMKKYILRNIKDNDINNYLFSLDNLKQKDLWDITIFGTKEFSYDFNKLVELDKNENNVVKYLYSKIYSIEIGEGDKEEESEENENTF